MQLDCCVRTAPTSMGTCYSARQPCSSILQQHVCCRHGARTPLTQRYWQTWGATWPDCQDKADAVRLAISAADGGPQPVSAHDKVQVSQYQGLKVYKCRSLFQHAHGHVPTPSRSFLFTSSREAASCQARHLWRCSSARLCSPPLPATDSCAGCLCSGRQSCQAAAARGS